MATAAVVATTTNIRINDSDSNTNWGNYGSGGGAPASEAQLAYLGTAVNTQVKTTALDGIDYNHGSGTNMESSTRTLWLVKVIVGDSFDLDTTEGVRVAIGSGDQTDMREFNIAGSGANGLTDVYDEYPTQGGYLITAINPDANSTYQEVAETGTPDWTAVDWWGVQCSMVVGGAKNENLAMDSIDIGSGLELHAGDGGSTDADMSVLLIADQGSAGSPGTRWGYVTSKGGIISCHGIMEVGRSGGSAAITEFTDNDSVVVFPDAYYAAGDCGLIFDLGNASTIMVIGMTIIGRGTLVGSDDTRPDHVVVGTSGTYTYTGTMINHRNVTFTSVCDVSGSIECALLTQASADIANAVIKTTSLTSVATLQDPTFGVTTDLHDTEFVQAGAGHAVETNDGTLADAVFQAAQTVQSGTGAVSVSWPTHADDDIGFLIAETLGSENPTLSPSEGFTLVDTIASTTDTRCTIWWKRADNGGSDAAPTISDAGDHVVATMVTFRGCRTTGDPWDAYAIAADNVSDTSSTFPDVTTLFDGQLVVGVMAQGSDNAGAWGSAQTNAGLTSITERFDDAAVDGNGGGINVFDATDTTAGTIGTTSITLANASETGAFTFALANEEAQYSLANLSWTGYGANETDDAAIDLTDTTGQIIYNISGGDTPTIKTAGAGWRTINTVNVALTGLVVGSQCYIFETATPTNVIMDLTADDTTETVQFNYLSDTNITIRVRKSSSAPKYLPFNATGTIINTGFSLVVGQAPDNIAT